MKDRGRDAGLDALDFDVAKADAFELAADQVDFAEVFDDPALADYAALRAAQLAGAGEAVGDDDAATGAKETARFFEEGGLVRSVGVATAFESVHCVAQC